MDAHSGVPKVLPETPYTNSKTRSVLSELEQLTRAARQISAWVQQEILHGGSCDHQLRIKRNDLVPAINRKLPTELLAAIFTLAVEQPNTDDVRQEVLSALVISGVCSRWRGVILCMPECWSAICLSRPKLAEIALSRVGKHSMLRTQWNRRNLPKNLDLLSALVSQITCQASQLLTIDITGCMHTIYPIISPLLSHMAHVSYLKLKNHKLFRLAALSDHINGGLPCPDLRHLNLVNVCILWTSPIFHSQLTHLRLEYSSDHAPDNPLPICMLFDILDRSPKMVDLSLQNCPLRPDITPDAHRLAKLHHLKKFAIVDRHLQPPTIIELLSRIIFPEDTTVLLDYESDDHDLNIEVVDELQSSLSCSFINSRLVALHALALTLDNEGICVRGWRKEFPACFTADTEQSVDPSITIRIVSEGFIEQDEGEAIEMLARMANTFRLDQLRKLFLKNQSRDSWEDLAGEPDELDAFDTEWHALATAIDHFPSLNVLSVESHSPLLPFLSPLRKVLAARHPQSEQPSAVLGKLVLSDRLVRHGKHLLEDFSILQKQLMFLARDTCLTEIHLLDCKDFYSLPVPDKKQTVARLRLAQKLESLRSELLPVHLIIS